MSGHKVDKSIIEWMMERLVKDGVDTSRSNHDMAVGHISQSFRDNWHSSALDWSVIRYHAHVAVGRVAKTKKGDAPMRHSKKVDTAKIHALSNDKLRSMIEARAGKKSALLPFLTAEWNRRQKKVWVPSPDKVIEDLLLLVAEENKERVRKYLVKHIQK